MEFSCILKKESSAASTEQQKPIEAPCPPVLLSILESEYAEERSRAERLDNKAMALLTIIIALITVYVPIYPFGQFIEFFSKARSCFTIPIILSIFIFMGIIAVIISIYSAYKLIDIYNVKNYEAVNIAYFSKAEKLGYNQVSRFQIELIYHYQSIILANSEVNQKKATALNKQYRNVIIIFVLLSISAIGTLLLISS